MSRFSLAKNLTVLYTCYMKFLVVPKGKIFHLLNEHSCYTRCGRWRYNQSIISDTEPNLPICKTCQQAYNKLFLDKI